MRRLIAALAGCALLLTGCSTISSVSRAHDALREAGYDNVTLSVSESSGVTTLVAVYESKTLALGGPPRRHEYETVAQIIWSSAPVRIDVLRLRITQEPAGSVDMRRENLLRRFGPRPAGLKEHRRGYFIREVIRDTVLIGIALLVFAFLVTLLVLVLWRRRRRRRESEIRAPA